MQDSKSNLELVPTEELYDEIAKRFDRVVLVMDTTVKKGKAANCVWYKGGLACCIGLAELARIKLVKRAMDDPDE